MSPANKFVAGQFREVWTEHLACNASSFSTTFASDSWEAQAGVVQLSPARIAASQTFAHDSTAYSTIPSDGDWHDRVVGYQNPARPTAVSGSFEQGRAT